MWHVIAGMKGSETFVRLLHSFRMEVVPYRTSDRNLPKGLHRSLYRKSTGKSGL